MKKRTVSFLVFILFVTALYVFQNTAVRPFIIAVASSDFFLTDDDDSPSPQGIVSEKTKTGLIHCHRYVGENFDLDDSAAFSDTDYKAWGLGGYGYLIRSQVEMTDEAGRRVRKLFSCKIQYTGGDEFKYENWLVSGLDFE